MTNNPAQTSRIALSRSTVAATETAWFPPTDSGMAESIKALGLAVLVMAPILAIGGSDIYSTLAAREAIRAAQTKLLASHHTLIVAPAEPTLPADAVVRGRHLFANTCAACHGPDATGVAGLGVDLTKSWFVASLDDQQLHEFLTTGRPKARPVAMPARGGNPTLTDADLADLLAHVRTLQDPRRLATAEVASAELKYQEAEAKLDAERAAARAARIAERAAAAKVAQATPPVPGAQPPGAGGAAAPADEEDAETIAFGKELFVSSCSSCHGVDAKGLPSNGKDLVHSRFSMGLDDEKMVEFIKRGRDSGDPLNTTKIAMPPKGGNPALSDEKLEAIVAYLRSLQRAGKPQA